MALSKQRGRVTALVLDLGRNHAGAVPDMQFITCGDPGCTLWWEFLASEVDGCGAKISCRIYPSLCQFYRKTSVFWLFTRAIPHWHIRRSISTHELQSVASDEWQRCKSSPAWVNSCLPSASPISHSLRSCFLGVLTFVSTPFEPSLNLCSFFRQMRYQIFIHLNN